jgi:hypothetical protein
MAKSQEQKKSQKEHRVAIVGAGFAGFNAGGRLPAAGPPFLAHAKGAALFAERPLVGWCGLALPHARHERAPCASGECQHRPAPVRGVTYHDRVT